MQRFAHFDLTELKLVYRVLHQNLLQHTELMDADFIESLQRWLQTMARGQGVDVADHGQWDAWLRGERRTSGTAGKTIIPFPTPD